MAVSQISISGAIFTSSVSPEFKSLTPGAPVAMTIRPRRRQNAAPRAFCLRRTNHSRRLSAPSAASRHCRTRCAIESVPPTRLSLGIPSRLNGGEIFMPLRQSRFCRRCRSSQFRRSHAKNLIERAISFAVVPVRCQYCGHRRYGPRWTVSRLGKTAVGVTEKTKGPQGGVTSNIEAGSPNAFFRRRKP